MRQPGPGSRLVEAICTSFPGISLRGALLCGSIQDETPQLLSSLLANSCKPALVEAPADNVSRMTKLSHTREPERLLPCCRTRRGKWGPEHAGETPVQLAVNHCLSMGLLPEGHALGQVLYEDLPHGEHTSPSNQAPQNPRPKKSIPAKPAVLDWRWWGLPGTPRWEITQTHDEEGCGWRPHFSESLRKSRLAI